MANATSRQEQVRGKIVRCLRVSPANSANIGPFKPMSLDVNDSRRMGGGGGGLQDGAARSMRNKLGSFASEEDAGFGSSYASMAWGRLEKGARDGYVGAIEQILHYSTINGWLGRRKALEGRPVQIAHEKFYEGPVKNLLSVPRVADKSGIIHKLVQELD